MAIEIEIVGNGKFAGARSSISSYSVTEDSTPLDPSDSSGGTGTIAFTAQDDPAYNGSVMLLNDVVKLSDTGSGTTAGTVSKVTGGSAGIVDISGDGTLGALNATAYIPKMSGTIKTVLQQILTLAGVTADLIVDAAIQDVSVKSRGGTKSYWLFAKELCTAYQVELAFVSNKVIARQPRQREAYMGKLRSQDYSVSNVDLAQYVEVAYYNYETITDSLVYPKGGWNTDVSVYQVDAKETRVINIPVDVALTSVTQPTMVASVSQDYAGPTSVYAIAGSDGLPIAPALWGDNGGYLTVKMGEDKESIDVTVHGMHLPQYAPYQIAMASGPSDYYSSLRLIGSGIGFTRKTVKVTTGAPLSKTSQDLAPTVDNPWIDTYQDALTAGSRAAGRYAAAEQTVTISATYINRNGENGSYVYPTFANFTATAPGPTFAAFDATWAGKTFAQFNEYQFDLVQSTFGNQVFGNVGGARFRYRDAMYRIRTATFTDSGITTATSQTDTIFSDFNTVWTGKTFAQFDAMFTGFKFEDFSLIPLART